MHKGFYEYHVQSETEMLTINVLQMTRYCKGWPLSNKGKHALLTSAELAIICESRFTVCTKSRSYLSMCQQWMSGKTVLKEEKLHFIS